MTRTKIFLISIFINFNLAYATKYCFNPGQSLFKIKKEVKQILLADEDVILDTRENCLEIAVRPYRKELVNKFIKMSFNPSVRENQEFITRETCVIQLRMSSSKKADTNMLQLGAKNDLLQSNEQLEKLTKNEMVLTQGRPSLLAFDGIEMFATCNKRGDFYEVEFSLRNDGDILASTSVDLTQGQWLEIGSHLNKLNKQINNKSIRDGIFYTKTKGFKNTKYEIMVLK